ncbi:MAG: hypothetical protein LBH05_08910 [Deferribacteraceae bacterium]|jgi:hypothetical protein|nr:hypothetical protein [Deferribacteraceae bacterium]
MEKTGLNKRITDSALFIYTGRIGLYTQGSESKGRLSFLKGVDLALKTFRDATSYKDPIILIQAELLFLTQEIHFCDKSDKTTLRSIDTAITGFNDALKAISVVKSAKLYKAAEMTYPTADKYRLNGVPKDALHIACNSHRTRLQNTLRTPGMNMNEKALYRQRVDNIMLARALYVEMQRLALEL